MMEDFPAQSCQPCAPHPSSTPWMAADNVCFLQGRLEMQILICSFNSNKVITHDLLFLLMKKEQNVMHL